MKHTETMSVAGKLFISRSRDVRGRRKCKEKEKVQWEGAKGEKLEGRC